jgi:hypothetical protein
VYAAEKSDTGVVPKKEPNKIGWPMLGSRVSRRSTLDRGLTLPGDKILIIINNQFGKVL